MTRCSTAGHLIVAASLLAAVNATAEGVHWSYSGETGPEHWAGLSEDFAACGSGSFQSPIDIVDTTEADLSPIKLAFAGSTRQIHNNGHTVQVNVGPGSSLEVGGRTYDLVQFHVHSPSEHRIGGKSFAMELHFVHRHAHGELAVVGVLFEEGEPSEGIEKLGAVTPQEIGKDQPVAMEIAGLALVPDSLDYYRYVGSLTTPPCTEGVLWIVLQASESISSEQVERFVALIGKDARSLQPLNGRLVLHKELR